MSKVLFCISNALEYKNNFYITCYYDQFIQALSENGNDVCVFIPNLFNKSTFYSENNLKDNIDEEKLRKDISDFSPDLVISFNGSTYNRIFECVSCPVLIYDADNYQMWNQREFIKKNKEKYTFFSFSEYGREEIKEAFSLSDSQIFYVPAATNLKSVKTEQTTNISFIGSFFQINDAKLMNFVKINHGKKALFIILNEIKNNPFISREEILKKVNGIIDDEMRRRFCEIDEKYYTFLFSGQNRFSSLLALCDMGLELYGNDSWEIITPYFPEIVACFNSQMIYSAEQNQDIYNKSKLCLNVVHRQSVNSMPWRVMDIMATNGCLLSEHLPMIDRVFGKYVKIPMFETPYDVRALAQKLLKDDQWRADIVAGSNLAIEEEYRFTHRFKQMEQILGVSLFDKTRQGKSFILSPSIKKAVKSLAFPSVTASATVTNFAQGQINNPSSIEKKKLSFKNKIRYKLWKHLNKKTYVSKIGYKMHKHLSKKLLKKGIITSFTPLRLNEQRYFDEIMKNQERLFAEIKQKQDASLSAFRQEQQKEFAKNNELIQAKKADEKAKNTPPITGRTHYKKLICGIGFYYSGSSAAVGLFSEFDNVTVSGAVDNVYSAQAQKNEQEHTFLRESALFQFIDSFYCDNKLKKDIAIKRWIQNLYFAYDHKGYNREYKPEIYNDFFLQISLSLILSTIKLDDQTREYMKGKRFPVVFNSSSDNRFENCCFMREKGRKQYLFYEFADISAEYFEACISNFIREYLNLWNSKDFLYCDHLLPSDKKFRIFNRYFPNNPIKQIAVWRDPRDQFISAFRNDLYFLSRDIDGYANFYKNLNVAFEDQDPNRLLVRFEDLVLKYDETTQRIFDFVGIDKSHHVAPKTIFDPSISAVNIGAYRSFEDQDIMRQIEERLGEYCYYPEKENLSEEAWDLLKANNFGE